ncbi:hypothetical protein TWF788_009280 [Orbilia oligospora]|uniref:Uncharacterized protein n=1 Tax=Orbilia oligospora TaxID=2813651 RepID=A0A7C8KG16_ORBOL|nr:hypothetical protein TWF788_009280 [Orbilia oligospora]
MENEWSKYAEKGIGTVVVHENLTSVKLFEVLFNISVSYTKTLTRKSSLDMHVEMGIEFAVEEKNMKGRYAVEIWYGDGDYRVEMNLKEAAKLLQLAGASRRDFLQRKKIAGEPISGGKVEMEEEDVGEE